MASYGRKSAYKRAYKEASHEGLRCPRRKPTVRDKYANTYRFDD